MTWLLVLLFCLKRKNKFTQYPMTSENNVSKLITQFLQTIGIEIKESVLLEDTFLPGLKLAGNCILLDPSKLKYPGDILHEAGHIATTPSSERKWIGSPQMDPNWPTPGDEIASIIWSYAAALHIGISPKEVFHSNGYKEDSEWLLQQFEEGNYIGLPLLEWMGFCVAESFPKMENWLRK